MTIKTDVALAMYQILTAAGCSKRWTLENNINKKLGRTITDNEFETAIKSFGRRIRRVRGVGGFIAWC